MGQTVLLRMWGTAAIAISVGFLCYLVDRPAQSVYFLPDILAASQTSPGGIHDSFPSFVHGFAISLLLVRAVAIESTPAMGFTCAAWWSIECLLEAAQHQLIAHWLCNVLPDWIENFPILENLPAYAIGGTFDTLDIIFSGLGCLAAFSISLYIRRSTSYA